MTQKEYDDMMADLRRVHARVKRSKKAARQLLLDMGLITPTGRPSRAKLPDKVKP